MMIYNEALTTLCYADNQGIQGRKLGVHGINAHAAQAVVLHWGTSAAPSSAPNVFPVPHLTKFQTENANISKTEILLQLSSC